jgi:hypothetical protein
VDPAGELVGILERRGADLKSAMNLPNPPDLPDAPNRTGSAS